MPRPPPPPGRVRWTRKTGVERTGSTESWGSLGEPEDGLPVPIACSDNENRCIQADQNQRLPGSFGQEFRTPPPGIPYTPSSKRRRCSRQELHLEYHSRRTADSVYQTPPTDRRGSGTSAVGTGVYSFRSPRRRSAPELWSPRPSDRASAGRSRRLQGTPLRNSKRARLTPRSEVSYSSSHSVPAVRSYPIPWRWFLRIFTTRLEPKSTVVDSSLVEEALELRRRKQQVAEQLAALSPVFREFEESGEPLAHGESDRGAPDDAAASGTLPKRQRRSNRAQWAGLKSAVRPVTDRLHVPPIIREERRDMTEKSLDGTTSDGGASCMQHIWCRLARPARPMDPRGNPYVVPPNEQWADYGTYALALAAGVAGMMNLAFFPYFMFFYDGLPWIVAHVIVGMVVAIPLVLLDLALGQVSQGCLIRYTQMLAPRARAFALVSAVLSFTSAFLEGGHAAKIVVYLVSSFTNELPWRAPQALIDKCANTHTGYCALGGEQCSLNDILDKCSINDIAFAMEYQRNIRFLNDSNYPTGTTSALIIVWAAVYMLSARGFSILATVAIWTFSFAVVVFLFLLFYGVTLPGAGFTMSILASGTFRHLLNPYLWSMAISQVLMALCVAHCFLGTFAASNEPRAPIRQAAYSVFLVQFTLSCLASLAAFPYLGYLRERSSSFGLIEVTASPDYFLYAVFPLALSYLPGAPVFCLVFFISLILIFFGSCLAQTLCVAEAFASTIILGRASKRVVCFATALLGCGLGLASVSKPVAVASIAFQQVGSITLALCFCITTGWLDGCQQQGREVGYISVILQAASFFGALLSMFFFAPRLWELSEDAVPHAESWLFHSRLSLLICIGTSLFALFIAWMWRIRRFQDGTFTAAFTTAAWWLYIGNVELLRCDVNDITTPTEGADLSTSSFDKPHSIFDSSYTALKTPAFSRRWSFVLKYLIPVLLNLALLYQFLHIFGGGMSGHDGYQARVFGVFFRDPDFLAGCQRAYKLITLIIMLAFLAGCIAPGAFYFGSPYVRLDHRRVWISTNRNHYKHKLEKFFSVFRELRHPTWNHPASVAIQSCLPDDAATIISKAHGLSSASQQARSSCDPSPRFGPPSQHSPLVTLFSRRSGGFRINQLVGSKLTSGASSFTEPPTSSRRRAAARLLQRVGKHLWITEEPPAGRRRAGTVGYAGDQIHSFEEREAHGDSIEADESNESVGRPKIRTRSLDHLNTAVSRRLLLSDWSEGTSS